mmetsp:Transcript_142020/g.258133  ORF Transcript_142020/g.258133 Transcript_142020/m.258133 type:complete len:254 (-) Transcript_142020:142-903(-)
MAMQQKEEEPSPSAPGAVRKKKKRTGGKSAVTEASEKQDMMPVAPAKIRSPKPPAQEMGTTTITSWAELEATKAKLASAMDRAEYFAASKNRLTDLSATQADQMMRACRNRSEPTLHLHSTLSHGVTDVANMLDDQQELLKSGRTIWKRVNALNRYVINQETQRSGKVAGQKAKLCCGSLDTPAPKYPHYGDIVSARFLKGQGGLELREPPLMSVKLGMTYKPPLEALYHGGHAKDSQRSPATKLVMRLPGLR